jgi:hypothetical protein
VQCTNSDRSALRNSVSGHKCIVGRSFEVYSALLLDKRAVYRQVSTEHLEAFYDLFAADNAVFIHVLRRETDAVGQSPTVALSDSRTHLIHRRETLLVRGTHDTKRLAGELLPEMIEKILENTGHRAVIIRGDEQITIRFIDELFYQTEMLGFLVGFGGVEGERRRAQIDDMYRCVEARHIFVDDLHGGNRHGFTAGAANNR